MIARTNRKMAMVLALSLILSLLATACGSTQPPSGATGPSQQTKETVKIGFFFPLSGSSADVGEMCLNAGKLAVEDINKAGGIKALGGAQVELVVQDTTSDPKDAVTAVERVLSSKKLAGAAGMALSPLTSACLPVIEKHQVPLVTTSIADQLTSQGYRYIFQIAPKGSHFGQTQVNFLTFLNTKYNLNLKKAAIVFEDSPYGTSTATGVKATAEKAGLTVVLNTAYPRGITNAAPLVEKIKQSGAQVLFPVSYTTDAELIMTALSLAGVKPLIIGGGAGFIWPAIGKDLGDKVNGLFSVASCNWDSKNALQEPLRSIPQRYKERYGTFMPEQAVETYASIWVLAAGIEAAKSTDPQKVRDALAQIEITSGPATIMQPGRIKFDNTGFNQYVHPVMIQWQKGEPHTVFPEEDASVQVIKP